MKYLLLFLPILSFAQAKFEQGYYVDNQGNKKECQIKNYDWDHNPVEIEVLENGLSKKMSIKEISEFAVGVEKKYKRAVVLVDTSSDDLKNKKLSITIRPLWREKVIFAKLLTEGKMNLYSFRTAAFIRFYYRLNSDSITPLIYKRYFLPEKGNQLGINKQYLMQLERLLDCGGLSKKLTATPYEARALSTLITKYNQCTNTSGSNYKVEKKRTVPPLRQNQAGDTFGRRQQNFPSLKYSGFRGNIKI